MLTKAQVKHIAKLACLSLTAKELEIYSRQLSEILNHIRVLRKLNTKEVEPTAQVTALENVFRPDEVKPGLSSQVALREGKAKVKGFFKVKAILEK
ncbi:MAG: Asp-tRNA(Asn)/Glu-tRNA(Gln) amidotransferase subunit GatC [Microgenomates group bacterium]